VTRIPTEGIDQLLQAGHLSDDRLTARDHDVADLAVEPARPALHPLRCESDRCQRVLDLVGDPLSDLAPRRLSLRSKELGQIIDRDHTATTRERFDHDVEMSLGAVDLELDLPPSVCRLAVAQPPVELLQTRSVEVVQGQPLPCPVLVTQDPSSGRVRTEVLGR
jgi:hypothetical protein